MNLYIFRGGVISYENLCESFCQSFIVNEINNLGAEHLTLHFLINCILLVILPGTVSTYNVLKWKKLKQIPHNHHDLSHDK